VRAVGTQRGRVSILIGVGAGLAVVSLLVLQALSSSGAFGTKKETVLGTSTNLTHASAVAPVLGRLYNVTFYEGPSCGGPAYLTEWGVQLGNRTKTQPSNITLSKIPENGWSSDSHFNLTTITFHVPSGVYRFTLHPTTLLHIGSPNGLELGGQTGVVTVTSSDVAVYTIAMVEQCG
jgi:hypothetical protein